MQLRDFGNAVGVALLSIGLMVGALSISLVEFAPENTPTVENNLPSPAPLTATPTPPPTQTPTLGLESPTPSASPTVTHTNTPPAACQPPNGWGQIIIQAGDTLDSIAAGYRTRKDELRSANCLLLDSLVAGTILYVPPVATSTIAMCVPGAPNWQKNYMVKSGDTFYGIGFLYFINANDLKTANCRTSDQIYIGEMLWVPNITPRTAIPRPTASAMATLTPYPTAIPATETDLPYTVTALPFTITVAPSNTPVPATPTAMPTLTASPTAFSTP